MNKPTPQTKTYFDYNECEDYINTKYGIVVRDYAGRFGKPHADYADIPKEKRPYLDFWHVLSDQYGISRGTIVLIDWEEFAEYEGKEWVSKIARMFHDEFGSDSEWLFEW